MFFGGDIAIIVRMHGCQIFSSRLEVGNQSVLFLQGKVEDAPFKVNFGILTYHENPNNEPPQYKDPSMLM